MKEQVFSYRQGTCLSVPQFIWLVPLLLSAMTRAQVSPVFSQHYNYEQFVNPAITGRDRYPLVNVSHRRNWIGTNHAPVTTCAGGSFRLGRFDFYTPTMMLNKTNLVSKDRMGFGGLLMNRQNGPLNQFYASLTYAYFVPMNASHTAELSFGLSAQLHQLYIDEGLLDPNDQGDPVLADLEHLPITADGGIGIYFHTAQFHAGGSINDLFHPDSPLEDERYFNNTMDFFFQTGYKFYLRRFDLEPSVFLARIDSEPFYYYARLKLYYQHYNWLAIAYKSAQSVMFSLGFRVGRLHIAYGYEQSVSSLSRYFSGSHEVMLGLNIGLFEPEGIRKTVKRKP